MMAYLQRMGHKFSLFDVPLVYNFSHASRTEDADLTKIFNRTLVKYEPVNAVVSVFITTASNMPSYHPSQSALFARIIHADMSRPL